MNAANVCLALAPWPSSKVGRKALGDNRLNCLNYPAGDGGHSSVFALLADNLNANRQSGDADHRHRDGRREKH
jgi:hypothetical protein